jgi:hypothetical protein
MHPLVQRWGLLQAVLAPCYPSARVVGGRGAREGGKGAWRTRRTPYVSHTRGRLAANLSGCVSGCGVHGGGPVLCLQKRTLARGAWRVLSPGVPRHCCCDAPVPLSVRTHGNDDDSRCDLVCHARPDNRMAERLRARAGGVAGHQGWVMSGWWWARRAHTWWAATPREWTRRHTRRLTRS